MIACRDVIKSILRDNLSIATTSSTDLAKRLKVPMPSKYSGADDVDLFEQWILDLSIWMRLSALSGPERDQDRVLVLGFALESEAHAWFNDSIATSSRAASITFEQAVLALHKRFVSRLSALDASEKFSTCTYSELDGVQGLYNALLRTARRMIEYPSAYQIRQQFIRALPDSIRDNMINVRGATAERVTDFVTLRDIASDIEQNNKVSKRLNVSSRFSGTLHTVTESSDVPKTRTVKVARRSWPTRFARFFSSSARCRSLRSSQCRAS